ncbi:MAG: hypothetical protein WCR27_05475, partial [Eubacteriales bacterium]
MWRRVIIDRADRMVREKMVPVIIEAQNLKKHYVTAKKSIFNKNEKTLHALDGVSLVIRKG